MKRIAVVTSFVILLFVSVPSQAETFTGDTKSACEALLCLATGVVPSECRESLRRYFSISARKLRDTIKGRANFLRLCPSASQTSEMSSLVDAMANGAGRCDAKSLNAYAFAISSAMGSNVKISNQIPAYCNAYTNHAYTDLESTKARYVGVPERGGLWVDPLEYERVLAAYDARIKAENEAATARRLNIGNFSP